MSDSLPVPEGYSRQPMTVAAVRSILLPLGPQDEPGTLIDDVLNRFSLDIDTAEDVLHDALAAGPWSLRSIRISGFRGAANDSGVQGATSEPFVLELPRSVDVVVVHASNGTGKSTVTDALEVALSGGTAKASAFAPQDTRASVAVYAGAERCEVTVGLDNDRGDRLTAIWRKVEEAEHAEVLWQPLGDPHGIEELPGTSWADAIAAHLPVVGYDQLTHRLRAGRLTEFLHETLSLGGVWWTIWILLKEEHTAATDALTRWKQVHNDVMVDLANLDESLAEQHPEVRAPEPLPVPDTPADDVTSWFTDMFEPERPPLLTLNVDRHLVHEFTVARLAAHESVERYRAARDRGDRTLWAGDGLAALQMLVKHSSRHHERLCPVCGSASAWQSHAEQTLRELRVVREEFNLAKADLTDLARLLTDHVLPLLRSGEIIPEISAVSTGFSTLVEPLINCHLDSDQDSAWHALVAISSNSALDQDLRNVVGVLSSASDVLVHWDEARRRCCVPLVAAQSKYSRTALRADRLKIALERVATAFDRTHAARRTSAEAEIGRPLGSLLADVDFSGLAIDVGSSGTEGLNETAALRLRLDGQEGGLGLLSAGQYNALVLALVLGVESTSPFRFQVLDDPVHAFDEFRTDAFAELVAKRATEGKQIVLLTHDEQLVEVLRHNVARISVIKLGRDEHGNIVQVDTTHPWQALVADARTLLQDNTNKNTQEHVTLSATTAALLVLAFCRQAVDAVLREFVVRINRGSPDLAAAVDRLEKARMTRRALQVVRKLVPEEHAARAVITETLDDSGYLKDLNAASHGDSSGLNLTAEHLTDRIEQTMRFCADLLRTTSS